MMPRDRCNEVRGALAAGDTGRDVETHVAACPDCTSFAGALAQVDDALAEHARDGARAGLPSALRTRILASALPAPPAPRARGRLLELPLRLAAVAALLWAVVAFTPEPLRAAELELPRLDGLGASVRAALEGQLAVTGDLDLPALAAGLPAPELVQPGWFAALAVLLLAGGLWLVRTGDRR